MLKRGIQDRISTNCMSAIAWNPVQRGMQTAKPSTAPTRATRRTGSGCLSFPIASTAMPNAIGTQITSERRNPWNIVVVVAAWKVGSELLQVEPEEREQREHAEDHRERIVVDVAGLHAAGHAREPADEARRAVDHDHVDDGLVAPRPESRAEAARAAGEEPVVEVVEAVLLLQDGGEHPGPALDHRGQVGPLDVEEPGDGHAGDG